MAKGIRTNKSNLGKRHMKVKRSKQKHKKMNIAAQKAMLKKTQIEEGVVPVVFRSTRQKIKARKSTQRRERSKSQMDVEAATKAATSTVTSAKGKDKKEEDDEEMACDE